MPCGEGHDHLLNLQKGLYTNTSARSHTRLKFCLFLMIVVKKNSN